MKYINPKVCTGNCGKVHHHGEHILLRCKFLQHSRLGIVLAYLALIGVFLMIKNDMTIQS